jgi:hypothetical protein
MTTNKSVKWGELSEDERDQLVGETFGIQPVPAHWENARGENHGLNSTRGDEWMPDRYPFYSTDLNAAVELARAQKLNVWMESQQSGRCRVEIFEGEEWKRKSIAYSDNLTDCFCIALLRHAGLEIITP